MIEFENIEDQKYFENMLLHDEFKDINDFKTMFDFRIPDIKRKEFNRIRNKILHTLKNQHGIKCMLKLECCDLESGTAIDHMIPISSNKLNKELRNLKAEKGRKVKTQSFGSNHIDNLIIACNNCNNRKKHRMLNHDIIMYILKEKRTAANNV